jgi:hypothetical protein
MTLIQVIIEPVVIEELLLGTICGLAAVVASLALLRSSPKIESSPNEEDSEIPAALSERLSMTVRAQGRMSEPLILCFTLLDPAVTLLRIEIANQLDKGVRAAQCVEASPETFLAELEPRVVQRWYNGNPYWDGETKRLPIRVFCHARAEAVCKTIWVAMCPQKKPGSGFLDDTDFAWFLEGPCPRAHRP